MWSNHYRDNTTLGHINRVDFYNFDFQQNTPVDRVIKVSKYHSDSQLILAQREETASIPTASMMPEGEQAQPDLQLDQKMKCAWNLYLYLVFI